MDRGRYVTLDCMRGIAAMVVACAHVNSEFAPIGFFAVDFFFALSGFVLALAYSSRLNENRRIGWFIRARVVRLFPLFLAGILFGALHKAQLIARGSEHGTSAVELLRSTILGALMLPDPYGHTLYPALLIGRVWRDFVSIVVSPSGCDNIRICTLRYASAHWSEIPMRRALFRTLRRGVSAARWQRPNRRGAIFHRTDGASSQAIERGPAVCRSARPQAR